MTGRHRLGLVAAAATLLAAAPAGGHLRHAGPGCSSAWWRWSRWRRPPSWPARCGSGLGCRPPADRCWRCWRPDLAVPQRRRVRSRSCPAPAPWHTSQSLIADAPTAMRSHSRPGPGPRRRCCSSPPSASGWRRSWSTCARWRCAARPWPGCRCWRSTRSRWRFAPAPCRCSRSSSAPPVTCGCWARTTSTGCGGSAAGSPAKATTSTPGSPPRSPPPAAGWPWSAWPWRSAAAGVPGFSGLLGRVPGGFGSGYGVGPGTGEVNLFAELSGRLNQDSTTEMLRVTTDDPDPFYLRFAVATEIGDSGFAPQPPSGLPVRPAQPGRAAAGTDGGAAALLPSDRGDHRGVQHADGAHLPRAGRAVRSRLRMALRPEQQVVFSRRARAAGLRYHFSYVRAGALPRRPADDRHRSPPNTRCGGSLRCRRSPRWRSWWRS